ncbi:MAG: hypothetical protein ABSG41_16595 [Bryobacteraceae bacterium]|jgi:hypothetical protein
MLIDTTGVHRYRMTTARTILILWPTHLFAAAVNLCHKRRDFRFQAFPL